MKKGIIFIIIYSFSILFTYLLIENRLNSISKEHIENERFEQKKILKSSIKHFELMSDSLLNEIIATDDILEILHQIVYGKSESRPLYRGKLYRELIETYNRLKKQSIRQLHFHFTDGRSMLRFHYPERSDDQLSHIRPSIANAQKGLTTHGYEEGRVFSGFRHVYPLYQGGTPVGSVELSNGFYHINRILNESDPSGNTYRIMIQKKTEVFNSLFSSQKALYSNSIVSDQYILEKPDSTLFHEAHQNDIIPSHIIELQQQLLNNPTFKQQFDAERDFSMIATTGTIQYTVHFFSIKNTQGKHAAYIIQITKDHILRNLHQRSTITFYIISTLMFFMILLTFAFIKSKLEQKRTTNRMVMISNNLKEGIYITDDKGTLTYLNPAALSMLGFKESELLNKNAHDMFHINTSSHSKENCFVMESIQTGQQMRFDELEFKTKTGEQFYVELSCTPVKKSNQIIKTINIFHNITEKKRREKELQQAHQALKDANLSLMKQVDSDGLTGIANRRSFNKTFDRIWKSAHRDQEPLSVLFIDIDFFKRYNDTYGHQQGDICLKKVANIIDTSCHRPEDLCARYGGEEFVVLLPKTTIENAIHVAKRIQKNLFNQNIPHETSTVAPIVTVSIGIHSGKWCQTTTPKTFLEHADQKLYEAKAAGRNTISY